MAIHTCLDMQAIVESTRRSCRLIRGHTEEDCCPWTLDACHKAMRGELVPTELDCDVARLCIIRGIRHHHDFGNGLRATGDALFIRALNARLLMSDNLPDDMSDPEHLPYCIWYPEVASEEACRVAAQRFPQLRYNIGRACAEAGYHQLYEELDLLPDISIAEEARDNMARSQGCKIIFDHIMDQHQRWLVMDDYTRTVREVPVRAVYGLNGDTAVRSSLERRRRLIGPDDYDMHATSDEDDDGFSIYFNITEDFGIDKTGSDEYDQYSKNQEITNLLWTPLPQDLPSGNKDVLILMAAWQGDVNRYARLRRPHNFRLDGEDSMVARGIHHNPMFARFWTTRPAHERANFEKSITARYIMSNDLSRVPLKPHDEPMSLWDGILPYNIWYPQPAAVSTYMELLRRQPGMKPAVARAYIAMNEQERFVELDANPDAGLLKEARDSPNPFYVSHLLEKCELLNLDPCEFPDPLNLEDRDHQLCWLRPEKYPSNRLIPFPTTDHFQWMQYHMTGRYGGYEAQASEIELFACAPDALRPPPYVHYLDLGSLHWTASRSGQPERPLESFLKGNMYQPHRPPKQGPPPAWDVEGGKLPPGVGVEAGREGTEHKVALLETSKESL